MNGLHYNGLIGDGDSNVHKSIVDTVPKDSSCLDGQYLSDKLPTGLLNEIRGRKGDRIVSRDNL